MLFDLKGKRRKVVQVTYLTLAVLMGGGLVLFGIGGEVSGGLFDAFSDRNQGTNGNQVVEERIDRNQKRVSAEPDNPRLRASLTRDYYQLATAQTTENQSAAFPEEARDELAKADANWRAYLDTDPENVDEALASVALQMYDPTALNKPKQAAEAAQLIARERNSSEAYLSLIQYAVLAKDDRLADLSGKKAIDLAPKAQRKVVTQQVKQLKRAGAQASG